MDQSYADDGFIPYVPPSNTSSSPSSDDGFIPYTPSKNISDSSSINSSEAPVPMKKGGVMSLLGSIGRGIGNTGIGFAKGIMDAPRLAAQGGEKLGSLFSNLVDNKPSAPLSTSSATKPIQSFQPQGTAQGIGYKGEKLAEFFVPGLQEGAGANLASKAATAGAEMAGKTLTQGGNPNEAATNAALGAGGTLASEGLGLLAKKVAPALKDSAVKTYTEALAPTTRENKAITETIVPGLLESKTSALSQKGLLNKFSEGIQKAGARMDEVLSTIPSDAPVNLKNVANELEKAKQGFMVMGADGKPVIADPQAVAHIEQFQNIIRQVGTENAPFDSVRKLRQIWDKNVAQAKGFYGKTVAEGSVLDATKEASNAIREELAKEFPNLAKVNADYSFWSKAKKVLEDTSLRQQGRGTPLTESIRRGAGAVAGAVVGGGPGALAGEMAMNGLSKLVGSTAWKTVTAVQKNSLANMLAKGNVDGMLKAITKLLASNNVKR